MSGRNVIRHYMRSDTGGLLLWHIRDMLRINMQWCQLKAWNTLRGMFSPVAENSLRQSDWGRRATCFYHTVYMKCLQKWQLAPSTNSSWVIIELDRVSHVVRSAYGGKKYFSTYCLEHRTSYTPGLITSVPAKSTLKSRACTFAQPCHQYFIGTVWVRICSFITLNSGGVCSAAFYFFHVPLLSSCRVSAHNWDSHECGIVSRLDVLKKNNGGTSRDR